MTLISLFLAPTIFLKTGVNLHSIDGRLIHAANQVALIYTDMGYECWITSAREGRHKHDPMRGSISKHFYGRAMDFRTRNVPKARRQELFERINDLLWDGWYVKLEGGIGPHIHIQLND